jgi:hypothetical protein
MKYALTSILVLIALNSFCCNCKTISKESELEKSVYVLIGSILNVTDTSFLIEPIEFFKGANKSRLLVCVDECSIFPRETENWLIFARELDNGRFFVSQCGWSRPINRSIIEMTPPPPVNDEKIDEIRTTKYFIDRLSYLEIQLDILSLRQMRISNEMGSKEIIIPENKHIDTLTKWTFILVLILLSIFIVFAVTVVFKIYR